MDDSETLLELIDKIIGYADNQPLILNHLTLLRARTEALEDHVRILEADTRHQKLAAELDRSEAALREAREEIEKLRHEQHVAAELLKKPPITVEVIERPPRRLDLL